MIFGDADPIPDGNAGDDLGTLVDFRLIHLSPVRSTRIAKRQIIIDGGPEPVRTALNPLLDALAADSIGIKPLLSGAAEFIG